MIIGLTHDTSEHRYFSGKFEWAQSAPAADTFVAARQDGKSIILVAGVLTKPAAFAMCDCIYHEARRPGTRLIFVEFHSSCGELDGIACAASVLESIPETVALVAFLGVAYGAALWFALTKFSLVFAKPAAKIGHLACGTESGEYDFALTERFVHELYQYRPDVELSSWSKLRDASINGEYAEMVGLVGGLHPSVHKLAGIPNGEER
jgi:hypothetical protein